MLRPAFRLLHIMRWLPLFVVVAVVSHAIAGWGSTVTVLAQADSENPQPADLSQAPTVDDSPQVLEEPPPGAAMPAPEDTQPGSGDGPSPQLPQASDVQFCVTVTSADDGLTVVVKTCPPDVP